ncbi:MAG: hypothetical protein JKY52_12955 [Flavobacteriales bacterium]|nr:hypothetical protein [Flavobacteriales bacterium]
MKVEGKVIIRRFLVGAILAALMLLPFAMQAQKIDVCHTSLSDSENVHTIEIERNALPQHLEHGDYLGACKGDEDNYFSLKVGPNPYFERTFIKYTLYEPANIRMEIYDQIGKRLKVLVNADLEPGKYQHEFNASDYGISHGIHFLKVVRITQGKEFVHFERLVDLH